VAFSLKIRRWTGLFLLLLTVCSFLAQPAYAEGEVLSDITKDSVFAAAVNADTLSRLSDKTRSTKWSFSKGTELTVSSEQDIIGLYILWDKTPAPYTLLAGGKSLTGGKNGFLHEYIALSGTVKSVTITAGAKNETVCDIYVFSGTGNTPDWVERWQPPLEKADMLLLPTHADDEHLFFGGTMPYYAGELKKKVQVAYLTHHWGEWYRPHELLNGLWKVGITAYPVISEFQDKYAGSLSAAQSIYKQEDWLSYEVTLLRRFKPDVVIGHDVDGEYGHGAHILNTLVLKSAIADAADPEKFPISFEQYGIWDTPKTYLHLYKENALVMDWDKPLEAFGGRTALDMAKEGFACHGSQTTYFKVEASGPYDCRKFGLFRTLVGPDTGLNDFFENILPPPPPEPESNDAPSSTDISETSTVSAPPAAKKPFSKGIGWAAAGLLVIVLFVTVALIIQKRKYKARYARSNHDKK